MLTDPLDGPTFCPGGCLVTDPGRH